MDASLDATTVLDLAIEADSEAIQVPTLDFKIDLGSDPQQRDAESPDPTIPVSADVRNVLLIIADDLGLDAISGFGFSESMAHTPHINSLCEQGLRFMSAYAHPTCSPTRASILTGRYPQRTGVAGPVGGAQPGLPLAERTLPELLNESGLGTVSHTVIGKWHLADADNGGNNSPNLHGFDHYSGLLKGVLPDFWSWPKIINGASSLSTTYATTDTVNDAIEWIDERNEPWFLMLAFNAPHTPYHVPPRALHQQTDLEEGACPEGSNYQCFMAMIEALDTEIGRLIENMTTTQRAQTQIFFIGDNGTANGVLKGYPARKGKDSLYEGGVHIPMCSVGPALNQPGRTTYALTDVTDLFPTVLELMHSNPDPSVIIDGHSIVPLLTQASDHIRENVISELGYTMSDQNRLGTAIRDQQFTLIEFTHIPTAFFDRNTDPFEQINLLDGVLTTDQDAAYRSLLERLQSR